MNFLDNGQQLPHQYQQSHQQHEQQQQHQQQPYQQQQQHYQSTQLCSSGELEKFKLAPPSASTINIRRHSSHHCQIIDKVSEEQLRLQTLPVLPPAPSKQTTTRTTNSSCNSAQPVQRAATPIALELNPPPVPRRNFKKHHGYQQQQSPNLMFDTVSEASPAGITTAIDFRRKNARRPTTTVVQTNFELGIARYGPANMMQMMQSSDDDLLNMDSPVFAESNVVAQAGTSRATNGTNPFQALRPHSNRSSSDSNKTTDTGYMTEPSADRIFFGESVDIGGFRARFSSVDTQSSIDSGCTDTTKCTSPPSSAGVVVTVPAVPKRRQTKSNRATPAAGPQQQQQQRGAVPPPIPPARTGRDSPRILQINSAAQQTVVTANVHAAAVAVGQEMFCNPGIHRARHITQRQDSNLSSDSNTYSPGYTSKSMERPLLPLGSRSKVQQHGAAAMSQVNGGCAPSATSAAAIKHADRKAGKSNGGGGGTMRDASVRQDTMFANECVIVTSSPGYNTKLIETPLYAHTDKLHTSKIYILSWHVCVVVCFMSPLYPPFRM